MAPLIRYMFRMLTMLRVRRWSGWRTVRVGGLFLLVVLVIWAALSHPTHTVHPQSRAADWSMESGGLGLPAPLTSPGSDPDPAIFLSRPHLRPHPLEEPAKIEDIDESEEEADQIEPQDSHDVNPRYNLKAVVLDDAGPKLHRNQPFFRNKKLGIPGDYGEYEVDYDEEDEGKVKKEDEDNAAVEENEYEEGKGKKEEDDEEEYEDGKGKKEDEDNAAIEEKEYKYEEDKEESEGKKNEKDNNIAVEDNEENDEYEDDEIEKKKDEEEDNVAVEEDDLEGKYEEDQPILEDVGGESLKRKDGKLKKRKSVKKTRIIDKENEDTNDKKNEKEINKENVNKKLDAVVKMKSPEFNFDASLNNMKKGDVDLQLIDKMVMKEKENMKQEYKKVNVEADKEKNLRGQKHYLKQPEALGKVNVKADLAGKLTPLAGVKAGVGGRGGGGGGGVGGGGVVGRVEAGGGGRVEAGGGGRGVGAGGRKAKIGAEVKAGIGIEANGRKGGRQSRIGGGGGRKGAIRGGAEGGRIGRDGEAGGRRKSGTGGKAESTNQFMLEMEAVMGTRRRRVQEVCGKYGLGPHASPGSKPAFKYPPTPTYDIFYIDKRDGLAWCPIYKAASTSMLYTFLTLAGISESYVHNTKKQVSHVARGVWPALDYWEAEKAITYCLKFMIVRHPFERLVSAFRDKLENTNVGKEHGVDHFYQSYGRKIVAKYRKGGETAAQPSNRYSQDMDDPSVPKPKGIEPTFPEFVRYLIDTDLVYYSDDHWMPYYLHCTPCLVDYDVIAKFETLDRDQNYIVRRAGLEDKIQPFWKHLTNGKKTADTVRKYFATITKSELIKLYSKYKLDFELFEYSIDEYLDYVMKKET